ncbi:Flavin_Reduct [Seminavis robusta]|uniref:Flavin_Reduct n=1 Tax=Seminavis robusta TaxID=568900 RepID=A0A9N8ESN0_9STRA|nr:Flavin_Reduct [Seminavis robusta]|eukprot:Sro1528_g280010.1 Flavin_Reduct (285) ;mRNA; r:23882-24736
MEGRPRWADLAAAGAVGFAVGLLVMSKRRPATSTTKNSKKITTSTTPYNRFDNRPSYTPGQTPPPPTLFFGKHKKIYNPETLTSCYNLVISSVTPRPIALVSSHNPDTNVDNVAPFSYFGAVAHDPPMLAIGFCRKGGQQKDSLVNILRQKQCCVNIMSEWYLDAANHSCGMFAPDVDEFDMAGLTKVYDCQVVQTVPRVGQAAVSFECVLEHVHPVVSNNNSPTTEIVLVKVVRIHVDESVLVPNNNDDKPAVDTTKLRPIGRLGGNIYTSLGDLVDIPRPKV